MTEIFLFQLMAFIINFYILTIFISNYFVEKEVQTTQKNYELEIAALKEQTEELAAKNDILDNALTNAQANVVHLEKEVNTGRNGRGEGGGLLHQ